MPRPTDGLQDQPYDLLEKRREQKRDDVAIIRIEQLYPFPEKKLAEALAPYTKAGSIVWCQEEPKNMGAWSFIEPNLAWVLDHIEAKHKRPRYAGRPASASTAAGLARKHQLELKTLLDEALG